MRVDPDVIWELFCKQTEDKEARMEFGYALLREQHEGYQGVTDNYTFASWMADHDDDFWYWSSYLRHTTPREEVLKTLSFHVHNNGMTPERAADILAIWEKESSNPEDPKKLAEAEIKILTARLKKE